MNKISTIRQVGFLLAAFLLCTTWTKIWAQAICPVGAFAPPTNFSRWDWETPESAPDDAYCKTWSARVATGGGGVQSYPMSAPWGRGSQGNSILTKIGTSTDYTKADGWELLRLDFGGTGGVRLPYFMLYHKPTGILRLYLYVVTTNPTTQVLVTMSHSKNDRDTGHSTGGMSLTQEQIKAADKYLTDPAPIDEETQNYVSFFQGSPGWTMAQFQMVFDPNTNSPSFSLNAYQFLVSSVLTSDVSIGGTFQFNTTGASSAPLATSDYSFAAPASVSGNRDTNSAEATALKITTQGMKYLGYVSTIGEKVKDINDKAKKTVENLKDVTKKNPALLKVKTESEKIVALTTNNTLAAIVGAASQLNATLGLIGSVIGILSSEDGSSSGAKVTPTISKGTITLSGTITTRSVLTSIGMQVPGTNHSISPGTPTPSSIYSQLPYYNCPLGIFAIRNTPRLERVSYQRVVDYMLSTNWPRVTNYRAYSSYQAINDIVPVFNPAAGIEVVSVKVAIGQKVTKSDLTLERQRGADSTNLGRQFNYVAGQVAKGTLEVYAYEPGDDSKGIQPTFLVQTPYVDISRFNGQVFNAHSPYGDQKVYVRVVAVMRRINMPSTTPLIYFSQDYAVDIVDKAIDTNSALYKGYSASENSVPPFDRNTCATSSVYRPVPNPVFPLDVVNTGNISYNDNSPSPLIVAGSNLSFDSFSKVQVVPLSSSSLIFQAGQSVSFSGELSIPETSNSTGIIMATGYKTNCAPDDDGYISPVSGANLQCGYDNLANVTSGPNDLRSAKTQDALLVLIPNPASTTTLVKLTDVQNECIQSIDILTIQGRTTWHKQVVGTCVSEVSIPLSNMSPGLYLVKVSTNDKSYVSRLEIR